MQEVRSSSIAGRFYPADPVRLRDQFDGFLHHATEQEHSASAEAGAGTSQWRPSALIAPHAGYRYSGAVAAAAFRTIVAAADIRRVVVIGPSHFVRFRGVALPAAGVFRTPLGDLEIDAEGIEQLGGFECVARAAQPHEREHSIEVELPFLQRILGAVPFIPLVTGAATAEEVAAVIDALWDDDTLLVVSSDLSHFHDYETACRLDAATAEIIVGGDAEQLDDNNACGRLAIQGMKRAAARRAFDVELLDLRNSGDTAGPRDEVVGYGAFRVD